MNALDEAKVNSLGIDNIWEENVSAKVGLYKFEEYGWFWNRRGKDVENHDSLLLIYTFEKRALKVEHWKINAKLPKIFEGSI